MLAPVQGILDAPLVDRDNQTDIQKRKGQRVDNEMITTEVECDTLKVNVFQI